MVWGTLLQQYTATPSTWVIGINGVAMIFKVLSLALLDAVASNWCRCNTSGSMYVN